ncbi:hypothetical protein [Streptomyces sp. WAC 01420]|uniref:hypothetical protein n=1 Tax=Streptomyces sp. WAC 01420 TaxID=2203203 RepID=UPI0026A5FEF9
MRRVNALHERQAEDSGDLVADAGSTVSPATTSPPRACPVRFPGILRGAREITRVIGEAAGGG